MKLLRAHFMGKPIIFAHFMGRRLLLNDIYAAENGGILFGDETLPLHATARFAATDSSEAFGDAADSFISETAVLPDADSGVSLGSVAEGEAYLDVSPTPVGVLGLEHSAPYINGTSHLPTPNGSLEAGHEAPTINGAAHIPTANGSMELGHGAETIKADAKFDAANSGAEMGDSAETFTTDAPVWAGGSSGAELGESAEGVMHSAPVFSEASSGEALGNDVEAYVETPLHIISAGTYYGRSNITSLDVGYIYVPFEATIDGVTESGYTKLHFYTALGDEYFLYGSGDSYLTDEIGSLDQIAINPDLWHLHLYSDDLSIRVLRDTSVSDAEYELFNKYFIPYQNVAFRGDYTFKHIVPSLYVNQTLPIPISFYVSGSAISGDEIRVTQFSANTYYYHAYANNVFVGTLCQVINGLAYPTVDGNTFRVTEDTPLTANELNMFDDLFIIYQQPTN